MRPLVRPTRATIHYHGTAHLDEGAQELTFSINGARWAYTLPGQIADDVIYLVKHVSVGKAFALAKKRATISRNLGDDPRSSVLRAHRGAQASRQRRLKVSLPNV